MPHFRSLTLVRRNPFCWQREDDGTIVVRKQPDGPVVGKFTDKQYGQVLNLIASRPEGTQLGALADKDVPADSLGRLLTGFGKPKPHASWIAAIAVDEGYADHENRGSRNGGLWLFPVEESAQSVVGGTAPVVDPGPGELGTGQTAAALRELAARVERAPRAETRDWSVSLEDVVAADRDGTLEDIATWEREVDGGSYVYRFDVTDQVTVASCVDAMSASKARNVGGRRFSRVNGDEGYSRCLYVGSSRRLASRIRQHLGLGHAGTYALQVAHWQSPEPLTGALHLRVFRLPPEVDGDVVQTLEDGLWRAARPVFGRLGSR